MGLIVVLSRWRSIDASIQSMAIDTFTRKGDSKEIIDESVLSTNGFSEDGSQEGGIAGREGSF